MFLNKIPACVACIFQVLSDARYGSLLALIVLKAVSLSTISLGFIFPFVLFSIISELLFH